jgi:hypothetical protein
MSKKDKELKNVLKKKFYEFEISGFEKFLKHLYQQRTISKDKKNWDAYRAYVEKQIEQYEKKLEKTKGKLSKL